MADMNFSDVLYLFADVVFTFSSIVHKLCTTIFKVTRTQTFLQQKKTILYQSEISYINRVILLPIISFSQLVSVIFQISMTIG